VTELVRRARPTIPQPEFRFLCSQRYCGIERANEMVVGWRQGWSSYQPPILQMLEQNQLHLLDVREQIAIPLLCCKHILENPYTIPLRHASQPSCFNASAFAAKK
jgi:hypothetical protein